MTEEHVLETMRPSMGNEPKNEKNKCRVWLDHYEKILYNDLQLLRVVLSDPDSVIHAIITPDMANSILWRPDAIVLAMIAS